ncbi:MAG TPA: carboxypeptidase regulatory-like domain-containing protein [Xanthobacteraceae bacterium]|nr:carboxypeptidase regulatory-like domain-containing protein [Xanthobacteraceae bacterium]
MKTSLYVGTALTAIAVACAAVLPNASLAADGPSLLAGKVVSSTGAALAGIPIKAHRNDSPITVAVYTDAKGEYSFPSWSDLTPGAYSIAIELPDFERATSPVSVAQGQSAKLDFALKSKPLAYDDATASEIIAALPGTDHQKVLFTQCSNCHSLQWALQAPHTKEEWAGIVKRMGGRASETPQPGTYAFSQKPNIEPLAEYLAQIRGPGSDKVAFKQRPRPTDAAATAIVVTEYDLPRGGTRDVFNIRGDRRFVWPHDVIANDKYAYYTDHFSFILGRVDRKTGEGVELPFQVPAGAGRDTMGGGDGRPGDPGGGAHELQFDQKGNVIIGMNNGTVKYDPTTGQFNGWSIGSPMFGLDPEGNVWTIRRQGELNKIDTTNASSMPTMYPIPKNGGMYDLDTDSKGRTHINIWRDGKIGIFDPKTIEYKEYKTPTALSGPRRGQIDAQNRYWSAQFYAGQVLMFDPDKQIIKEFPLINGAKPYSAPYAEPYSASVDDKHQVVWTNDFASSRIYRIDIDTGHSTEFMTPSNYEIRDFKVEVGAERPTVWIPAYRAPAKLVKVVVR